MKKNIKVTLEFYGEINGIKNPIFSKEDQYFHFAMAKLALDLYSFFDNSIDEYISGYGVEEIMLADARNKKEIKSSDFSTKGKNNTAWKFTWSEV